MAFEAVDQVHDVVIMGGGLAGWSAAVSAAESGARPLLLEKLSEWGGSTVISEGRLAFAGTDIQQALGIQDSTEQLRRDLEDISGGTSDQALIDAYVDDHLELYKWMTQRGVMFKRHAVQLASGQSVPRSHWADTRQMVGALRDAALQFGAEERYNCAVVDLTPRPGGWSVTTGGGEQIAAKTVILASGGFTRSPELLSKYAPLQAKALVVGGEGNVGDGLRIALKLGAHAKDFEYIKSTYGMHPSTQPNQNQTLMMFYLGGVILNVEGERFVDESLSYKQIGEAVLHQPDAMAFQVFDAKVFANGMKGEYGNLQSMFDRGMVYQDNNLEGLADKIGVNAKNVVRSIDAYNHSVAVSGYDTEVGRKHLVYTAGDLVDLDTPPYYAFPARPALITTYCGVTINADAQVTTAGQVPIEGLYAAGEILGGFHGKSYMTGTSLGKAALFGRRAGINAAHATAYARRP